MPTCFTIGANTSGTVSATTCRAQIKECYRYMSLNIFGQVCCCLCWISIQCIVFLCRWFHSLLDIYLLFSYANGSGACWILIYCFLMQVVPGPAGYLSIVFLCKWFRGLLDINILFSYAGGSRACWISIYCCLMQVVQGPAGYQYIVFLCRGVPGSGRYPEIFIFAM